MVNIICLGESGETSESTPMGNYSLKFHLSQV